MICDSLFVFSLSDVVSQCPMSSVSHACTERLPSPSKTLKVIYTYCPLLGDITTVLSLPSCFLSWLIRAFVQSHLLSQGKWKTCSIFDWLDYDWTGMLAPVWETILNATPVWLPMVHLHCTHIPKQTHTTTANCSLLYGFNRQGTVLDVALFLHEDTEGGR